MLTLEESIRRELKRMSENDDSAAEGRILERVRYRRRLRRRSYLALAAGLVVATGSLSALNVTGVLGGNSQPGTFPAVSDRNFPEVGCDKRAGTPASVARESNVPVWLPDKAANVTDAWTCGPGGVPWVQFGNIEIMYEPGWDDVNVEEKWAALANDPGDYVTSIREHPALVSPAGEPTPFGNYGQVMLVVDGTLIRVRAPSDVPIQRLVGLARSLDLEHPIPAE